MTVDPGLAHDSTPTPDTPEPPAQPHRRLVLVALVVLGLATAAVVGFAVTRGDDPPPVVTAAGATDLAALAAELEAAGMLDDAAAFVTFAEARGGMYVAPGVYELARGLTHAEALAALRDQSTEHDPWVTFVEGFTLQQMADKLSVLRPHITTEAFLAAAEAVAVPAEFGQPAAAPTNEGLLFPSTYRVSNTDTAEYVVAMAFGQMQAVATETDLAERAAAAAGLGLTPYEVLIVASLIEREAGIDADRPMIARVIYNRLARDMELQIDAALYYGAEPGTSFPDLRRRDTPYNVYMYKGLPPTPIAAPSLASIEAALAPADNPPPDHELCADLAPEDCVWTFYVLADDQGGHVFTMTYEQHLAEIDKAIAAGVL
ncbi:MAG TPA: endolytic transglycosylase MltG [Ilumatobacter sp.]|nr:endolytic transglycosylase MltG [Ilumatobacter sp.]